jgi:hypothetical protein
MYADDGNDIHVVERARVTVWCMRQSAVREMLATKLVAAYL